MSRVWNALDHYYGGHGSADKPRPFYMSDSDKKAMIKMNQRCLGIYPKKGVPVTWRNVPSLMTCVMPIDLDVSEEASWTAMLIGHDRKGRRVEIWLSRELAIHCGCTVGGKK